MGHHAVHNRQLVDVPCVSGIRMIPVRVVVMLALIATFGVLGNNGSRAYADDPGCPPGSLDCVGVGAGGGGQAGGGGGGPERGTGGRTKLDPCAKYPGAFHTLCEKHQGTGLGCLGLYDQYFGTMTLAAFNQFMTDNGCPTVAPGATPPPTPAELAQQAADSFYLPHPSGHRSPPEGKPYNEYPFTYVNLWTFYWSDPGSWSSLTATASAGGNWATVTAKPASLTFDPGNGSAAVSCAGPGRPWVESDGNSAPSQGACGYQYSKVTGPGYNHPVTSTQTITWQLTWIGSGNTSGTLTQRTTATNGQLNVLQIKTVNR